MTPIQFISPACYVCFHGSKVKLKDVTTQNELDFFPFLPYALSRGMNFLASREYVLSIFLSCMLERLKRLSWQLSDMKSQPG